MAKPQGEKLIVDNRRARHDYHLTEKVEAGLALAGTEVKALRDGKATLQQAYAEVRDGEAWTGSARRCAKRGSRSCRRGSPSRTAASRPRSRSAGARSCTTSGARSPAATRSGRSSASSGPAARGRFRLSEPRPPDGRR